MDYGLARQLGEAMCKAWGLNPADVLAIDLHWRPTELPTATVELLTTEGVVREVLTLTRADPTATSDT